MEYRIIWRPVPHGIDHGGIPSRCKKNRKPQLEYWLSDAVTGRYSGRKFYPSSVGTKNIMFRVVGSYYAVVNVTPEQYEMLGSPGCDTELTTDFIRERLGL